MIPKYYLLLQADYENIVAGLCLNGEVISTVLVHKMDACKKLMVSVVTLLESHQVSFSDLEYIAVNQGPAPFTTLRIVVTTANALSFAHKVLLVGIDALQALGQEYIHSKIPVVALLNAFSQDVYFSIVDSKKIETGCGKYDLVLQQLTSRFGGQPVLFVGNGVDLYRDPILAQLPQVEFLAPNPGYVSFSHVAGIANRQWLDKVGISETVLPLYLKIQVYPKALV